ncbi:hypothetical protein [Wolbachia endosymbiont (group A) of Agelastica alni]|uniref:hypothetical protein n=1 Tax=Wolbachia endosymbiont (group A) of Agelastica alni TaxID=3066130 RepID=UPI0033418D6A
MGIGQQQLTGKIATRDLMLQSSTLKQKSFSDKVSDIVVSGLIDDTVKLSRSKRSKKGKKGLSKQRVRNKWNTKKQLC